MQCIVSANVKSQTSLIILILGNRLSHNKYSSADVTFSLIGSFECQMPLGEHRRKGASSLTVMHVAFQIYFQIKFIGKIADRPTADVEMSADQ